MNRQNDSWVSKSVESAEWIPMEKNASPSGDSGRPTDAKSGSASDRKLPIRSQGRRGGVATM